MFGLKATKSRKANSVAWLNITAIITFLVLTNSCCLADSGRNDVKKSHTKVQSDESSPGHLAEQARLRRKRDKMRAQWRSAFREIKSLVDDFSVPSSTISSRSTDPTKFFSRWKLLLDNTTSLPKSNSVSSSSSSSSVSNTIDHSNKSSDNNQIDDESYLKLRRQRFDGFASWEERLQQWADDAAEYMESANLLPPNTDIGKTLSSELPVEKSEDDDSSLITPNMAPAFQPRPAIKGEPVLPHTDISDPSKKIWIVTTAALPWMTGTAVNPLLRAAYLNTGRKQKGGKVTIMLPWLEREEDKKKIYGDRDFQTQNDQEQYIRNWLKDTAGMKEASRDLNIAWYTGWVETLENSVYSMGDITALIPQEEVDICVLEEPEHLNWYRAPGENWTTKFKHVVGIVHTNYFVYAQEQPAALIRAPAMRLLTSWMCRAHCHRLIKLSGTLGSFAPEKELVENVHGVRLAFLEYGKELSNVLRSPKGRNHPVFGPEAEPTIYFIGKMLWSKGIGSLMELIKYAEESADLKIKVDMYGGGPDKEEATQKAQKLGLDMPFHGPIDHALLTSTHKIFVNPSTSEVLCTTVAEALAMGKFVVVPSHPSNDFFAQFPNCLTYANKEEFVGNLYYAMTHSPQPLSKEYSYALSWEAASERFAAAGSISVVEADIMSEALKTEKAGIEIDLPPIIEDEKRRKQISSTIVKNRERYRQFRSRLSQEIRQSNVLPKELQRNMIKELDKRLNLDVDELLASPKMKIKLSPAELDKQLLELHDFIRGSPSGDVLRVIGGGANVGRQNLYLKNQALKVRKSKQRNIHGNFVINSPLTKNKDTPQFLEDIGTGENPSVPNSVKRTLRQYLVPENTSFVGSSDVSNHRNTKTSSNSSGKQGPTMTFGISNLGGHYRADLMPRCLPRIYSLNNFSARPSRLGLPLI